MVSQPTIGLDAKTPTAMVGQMRMIHGALSMAQMHSQQMRASGKTSMVTAMVIISWVTIQIHALQFGVIQQMPGFLQVPI